MPTSILDSIPFFMVERKFEFPLDIYREKKDTKLLITNDWIDKFNLFMYTQAQKHQQVSTSNSQDGLKLFHYFINFIVCL